MNNNDNKFIVVHWQETVTSNNLSKYSWNIILIDLRIKFYFKKTIIGLRHCKKFTCSYPGTNT